jgi:hypothetical protein
MEETGRTAIRGFTDWLPGISLRSSPAALNFIVTIISIHLSISQSDQPQLSLSCKAVRKLEARDASSFLRSIQ